MWFWLVGIPQAYWLRCEGIRLPGGEKHTLAGKVRWPLFMSMTLSRVLFDD
ncbi:hypothetical protein O9929_22310 [Vibrio lentus]|nr:hypothetical protein [Vibrio lentus]